MNMLDFNVFWDYIWNVSWQKLTLFFCLQMLQDVECSRSYIDELYSPEGDKCLEAIV
jgi:hypothetical protein